jgi:signal transduction histidine kinase
MWNEETRNRWQQPVVHVHNELILFEIDEQRYGLDLWEIQQVVRVVEITPVPGAPSMMLGLFNLQGPVIPVDLDAVIKNQISHFPEIPFTYRGARVMVYADDLVGQIFTNLIGNSRKFAGEETAITIGVEEQEGVVEVTVVDNGPGIPDDQMGLVFDRFQKGTTSKSGKGLGLFITRTLVVGYGGTIWAAENDSEHLGASIHFTLQNFY